MFKLLSLPELYSLKQLLKLIVLSVKLEFQNDDEKYVQTENTNP